MIFSSITSKVSSFRKKRLIHRQMKPDSSDLEFMPDILALIETPPSPIATKMMLSISIVIIFAIAWSYFGWIDIQAIAHGKIQPTGRTKLIQPNENGIVKSVLVHNGSHVKNGDLIVELDPIQISIERSRIQFDLISSEAESIRRQAAINAIKDHGNIVVSEEIKWPTSVNNDSIKSHEEAVFESDIEQLTATHKVLDRQIAEKQASLSRLNAQIDAQERVLEPLRERMDMRQTLFNRGTGSRLDLINSQHDYARQNVEITTNRGQIGEIENDIIFLKQKIIQASAQFKSSNTEKLLLAFQKINTLNEALANQTYRLDHTKIYAPVTGTVQELIITTPGQIVSTGQQLMSIVPTDVGLEIEAAVINSDIGFVRVGQNAILKFDAFPFTRYGTLSGRVDQVSRDAIASKEAGMRPSPHAGGSSISSNGSKPVGDLQDLVFPITVIPDTFFMDIDGSRIPLSSGMEVTVEIQTGKRRVIDYLLSPLFEIGSTAFRER